MHAHHVQRLFSMFPRGWPGAALLLLRASIICALLVQNYDHRQQLEPWLEALGILVALALLAGYQTPLAAAVGILFHALVWVRFGMGSGVQVMVFCLDALALALLGPGAYSIDGYRFGRRVVVLPPC
jgi:putative oxidoreductase